MTPQKELDFGMKCIKYMLCVANLMFVLVGMLLISIGFTVKGIYKNFEEFIDGHYYNPSTLAVIIGFFIFFIAMFGCVGALKESTLLINTYAFFLILVLILEISVSIAAYVMRYNIEDTIVPNMKFAMENYDKEYNAYAWNATQYNLQCCGIYNSNEWNDLDATFPLTNVTLHNSTIRVPTTCCAKEDCTSADNLYGSGCLGRLSYIISQCALLLAIGAVCVSFIQILGIAFARMLAKSIRKLKTQMLVAKEERRRNFYEEMTKDEMKQSPVPYLYIAKESEA